MSGNPNNLAPDDSGDLRAENARLKEENLSLEARVKRLLEQNNTLNKDHAHLKGVFDQVLNSLSWRITTPLRKLALLKRKLFPLVRNTLLTFEMVPENNIVKSATGYSIVGPTPFCLLKPQERYPTRWVKFSAKLDSKLKAMFFILYHGDKEGFNLVDRLLLPFSAGEISTHLFKLPNEVSAFRIDPFASSGEFNLSQLSFQELGTLQVLFHVLSKQLRPILSDPKLLWIKLRKAGALLKSGGLLAIRQKLFTDNYTSNYQEWVRRFDTIEEEDRGLIREDIERLQSKPKISILMPTFNTPLQYLKEAIESVRSQLYSNWELCIADDCSTNPEVIELLKQYSSDDARIKVCFRSENGHISRASNSALELASGEFIALLDHDDLLSEHALYMLVKELNLHPETDLIFSDEDKITSFGARLNPYFKSDWNPELMCAQNCVCHLVSFRTSLVRSLGGFREGVEGAQDWDLTLRVADMCTAKRIRHIPHVLYHWRIIEGSTAQSTSFKPYVMKAQSKVVSDHLERIGVKGASVEILNDISQLRVHYPAPSPAPLVSIIIPTKDCVELLQKDVESICSRSDYKNFEIIIVDNGSIEKETLEYLDSLSRSNRAKVIKDELPFNYSRINNSAAKIAKGELLAFLNNDLEVINSSWLTEMVSLAVRPEIGAVGARLWYPNDTLQHAGVFLGIGGIAGHNHKGRPKGDVGYFNRAILPQNLSAVTAACLVMRREVFEQIGGFEEELLSVAFNDVDLCLRIREAGYLIVWTPYAELYHYESASRGYENTPEKFRRFEKEIENMRSRWKEILPFDPYYNPNLSLIKEDMTFAFPPRAKKPWIG